MTWPMRLILQDLTARQGKMDNICINQLKDKEPHTLIVMCKLHEVGSKSLNRWPTI